MAKDAELISFKEKLKGYCEENLLEFTRREVIHGTPFIFRENERSFYDFQNRIAKKWNVIFHEIYITGSAKLGFSFFKDTMFDENSDIDVAIVSNSLFNRVLKEIENFQWDIREKHISLSIKDYDTYHKFLQYLAIGWIRPDLLPIQIKNGNSYLRNEWFDFFEGISYEKSEVGNYKVTAGIFKSYLHFERYIVNSVSICYRKTKSLY
ncbi:hypothetical protein NYR66_10115 [Actinobacillus equuli subsp. haemolyticus]|uniref:hypothetical protein n=1 Tax=Actinobacillus equuli TaxID=718 RepID=UPI0024434635|nr:hypothetical protein [Actinobacillus equuli]WGE81263.1 hypothetical protein NYR66_10115 [Actinobacillus equuli subsp. haemolyticus]